MSTKRKAPTKAPTKLAVPAIKRSAKVPTKATIDESRTEVSSTVLPHSSPADTIEISSDPSDDEDFSEEEESGEHKKVTKIQSIERLESASPKAAAEPQINGEAAGHDSAVAQESDDELTEPSFGELLRNNQAIDVTAMLQQPNTPNKALSHPQMNPTNANHQSLVTVLTQALRTDDVELLESCFSMPVKRTVRTTIERLDSMLAGVLLTKLAARFHSRPGRAGQLVLWIQWTLVAHGGALASQTQVTQTLKSLQKVLNDRAKGINSLLSLKGKLELLQGQMDLRKQQANSRWHQDDEDQDDDNVIWVEGRVEPAKDEPKLLNGVTGRRKRDSVDSDASDNDKALATNGFMGGDSDDEGDSASAGDDGDQDDSEDAEEALDEDEADDVDGENETDESAEEEDESDIESAAPPAKVRKVGESPFSITAR